MNYMPRPGIVCAELCGRHVLIPARRASDACKTIYRLSGSAFFVWTAIEKDFPMEKLLELYSVFSKLSPDAQRERIEKQCQDLLNLGFIIPKDASVTAADPSGSQR